MSEPKFEIGALVTITNPALLKSEANGGVWRILLRQVNGHTYTYTIKKTDGSGNYATILRVAEYDIGLYHEPEEDEESAPLVIKKNNYVLITGVFGIWRITDTIDEGIYVLEQVNNEKVSVVARLRVLLPISKKGINE